MSYDDVHWDLFVLIELKFVNFCCRKARINFSLSLSFPKRTKLCLSNYAAILERRLLKRWLWQSIDGSTTKVKNGFEANQFFQLHTKHYPETCWNLNIWTPGRLCKIPHPVSLPRQVNEVLVPTFLPFSSSLKKEPAHEKQKRAFG